jgi:hypothetical protein
MQATPSAWLLEEFDNNGALIWCSLMLARPTDLQWFRDLPTKKHHIVLTPLFKDESRAEKLNGIKSYKESTAKMMEAYNGL